MTRLSDLQKQAEAKPSRLAATLGQAARGRMVQLPVLGSVYMALLGHVAVQEVESEVFAYMAELKIELSPVTALSYEAERAARTLSRAVYVDATRQELFGALEDWRAIDSDLLSVLWLAYSDLREELSPLPIQVDDATRREIAIAVEKKSTTMLRSFGVATLAAYLATMGAPPSTSPSTKSNGGDSSPGT